MSRKLGKSIFASTGLAILAVSVAGLALASIPSGNNGDEFATEQHGGESGIPAAVGGVSLFDEGYGPLCYDKDDVLAYFDRDRGQIGGEMVTLETGFDQDFADAWRYETELEPVKISGVFAHIFANESGFNMVDVVEIGADGCAISRTLLTEEEWNAILVRAAGVSV
ncbi:MAG TPA: hypothetical protein VFK86_19160 [Bauldia sp.]|nr:hypothetical protein [Bauldia sp.]